MKNQYSGTSKVPPRFLGRLLFSAILDVINIARMSIYAAFFCAIWNYIIVDTFGVGRLSYLATFAIGMLIRITYVGFMTSPMRLIWEKHIKGEAPHDQV